jgi:hypothetical protein
MGVSLERIEHDFERVVERLAPMILPGLYEQVDDPELRLRIDRAEEMINTYARQARKGLIEGNRNRGMEWKKMLQNYEASWMAAVRYTSAQKRENE